ncbi:retrovirus-related pol polyprotein from transposon TNT 1-94 [Tanacetum coccineum]
MGEPLSPERIFDFLEDKLEPHPTYDFFAPALLPRYAGNPNNKNRWLAADDYLLGDLEAMVDEQMVVPAIEEVVSLKPSNKVGVLYFDSFASTFTWVEAEMVSPKVESEKWRRLLLHWMYDAFAVSTDGREEDFFPLNGMRSDPYSVTRRLECVYKGEKIGDSSRLVMSVSILKEPIKVAKALSRTMKVDLRGFIDYDHPRHVYKFKKALYGLKQAPRAWYDELSKFLLHNYFFKGTIDPTLFIRRFDDDILVAKPTEKHLKEVKRIFRYLRGTVNMGLWYTKDSGFELTGFSDADYAGCRDTFKSTFGGTKFLGESW